MMAIDFKMDQTTGIRELDVPMKIIHCNKSFTEDGNLDHFLVELGHKMPVFCKSIDCLDDGQLSYLQFTDSIEHRSSLPIEEMLSPLLVLLVCERIFREYVLVDHLSDQSRSTDNIYASYNQVLIDFDGILVLLSEIRGETVLPAIDKSLSPHSKSNKNLHRLHRRTKHIIEDLCTLIGMRLGMLDVLNAFELKEPLVSSTGILSTLDRIIACDNIVRSKHVQCIIERAVKEAKAVRSFFLAKNALFGARYTESTILILNFKLMVKSLSSISSPRTDVHVAFCSVEEDLMTHDHIREIVPVTNHVIREKHDSHHNYNEKDNDNNGYSCNIKNHHHPININNNYECRIPNNFDDNSKISECSATISVLKDLSMWLAVHHKLQFQEILSKTENFIHHEQELKNKFMRVKKVEVENEKWKENINTGNMKRSVDQCEYKIENSNTIEIGENIAPKNFQILSNIFSLKHGTSFSSIDRPGSSNTAQDPSNLSGIVAQIPINERVSSSLKLDSTLGLGPDIGMDDSGINNSSSSSSSNTYSEKGYVGIENKLLNFGRVLNSSCFPAANAVMSVSSPRSLEDESNIENNTLLQQQRLEHFQNSYICPPRSEWGNITFQYP